ncbi:hypothetical protein HJTV-2_gp11 [Haloarcula virus HJTV-2]|uniref:Uncharacterized protein n=1 Tax=Haloarcula virus HJTV-2 TaxID=2877986 RepID=A0AAE8XW82_9CAUD|nr:hypothetical protein M1M33_gp136 [Haloarcula virus HJTV-2]UBF21497.1 hypothetical protein HRTV-24_gp11 [Halorubrum virus HRTV-24]UBF21631.1 hypothetical protein HJTV-2_gp11 [Haloarcula virus HJTV-2]UBF21771.1 hypothetical protein HSTV-3_gp11 [Halorubrum virus HSTV-3]UBF21900.1 hypothetical protein HJTV-3_gp11 [Haloarcula virus HJTV-3]
MDFQKVTFDTDLDEMEADELADLVRQFSEAQEQNIAEFEQASETIEGLEGRVSEVQDFDAELTEELAESSPLGEDELANFSISRKRELLAEFAEANEEDEEEEDEDEEAEFSDMGQRGETHDEEAEADFAKQYLGDIPGLGF